MHFVLKPAIVLAILAAWAATFMLAVLVPTAPLVLEFSYYVLPISAFLVPPLVGLLGAHFATSRNPAVTDVELATNARATASLVLLIAIAVVASGYLICLAVLSRLLEIPWRTAKFGDPTLDLGMSGAQAFAVLAAVVFVMALALFRNVPGRSCAANFAAATMGMIAFAGALYLAFGLSPLVEWRD